MIDEWCATMSQSFSLLQLFILLSIRNNECCHVNIFPNFDLSALVVFDAVVVATSKVFLSFLTSNYCIRFDGNNRGVLLSSLFSTMVNLTSKRDKSG